MDARQQLARVEGLGQVVVGADLEADDAVDVLDLGGEHDDRRRVVGRAQAAADRQAVFAGQHQVEHDQVDGLARQHAVQRLGVFGQQDLEAFLRQVAAQQVADARIVVDDDDAVGRGRSVAGLMADSKFVTTALCKRSCRADSALLTSCYSVNFAALVAHARVNP